MSDRFITVIQKVDIGSEESIAYAGNDTHESKWEKSSSPGIPFEK